MSTRPKDIVLPLETRCVLKTKTFEQMHLGVGISWFNVEEAWGQVDIFIVIKH